jgi:HK97 family phage portal protein
MNLLAPFRRINTVLEQRIMGLGELDRLMDLVYYGFPSISGQPVTVENALTTSAVWACVQAISKTISALPCELYKKNPSGGKTQLTDHRVARILDAPNDEQTPLEFWETMITHRLIYGNAFAQVEQDAYGPKALWILNPQMMTVRRNKDTRSLEYVYGRDPTHQDIFPFGEIFHLRGRSTNGITGLPTITLARQTIGIALALESYGAAWFANGSNPGGFLSTDGTISPEAAARLKADWETAHQGVGNAHKVAVLEGGLKWNQVTVGPNEAQFNETRLAIVEDIARWFGVPPHKIGVLGNVNKASIEEQELEWYTETIRPECTRIAQTIQRDLINISDGKRGIFAAHDFTEMLRGNTAAQTSFHVQMRQWGILCADEIRENLGYNPLPDGIGQVYLNPMNMTPAGQEPPTPVTMPDLGVPNEPTDNPPPDVMPGVPGLTSNNSTNGHAKTLRDLVTVARGGN